MNRKTAVKITSFFVIIFLLLGAFWFITNTSNNGEITQNQQDQNKDQTGNDSANQYSIEQAISDNAQLNTLAFSGLGFLTGNMCSDSFLPHG
jgi:hypothetical protein